SIAGQNDQVVFSGTAGQKISLVVNSMTNYPGYVDLAIIGPAGVFVPWARISANSFLDPRTINLVLPATGSYTILIDPEDASTGGTTQFTLYQVVDVSSSVSEGSSTPWIPTTTPGQTLNVTFSASVGQNLTLKIEDQTP